LPAYIPIPPEKLAEARTLYEAGDLTTVEVARFLGLSKAAFYNRFRTLDWKRRRRAGASDRSALATERGWLLGEAVKPPPAPDPLDEAERSAAVLASLARSLMELEEIDRAAEKRERRAREAEEESAEIEEMRRRMGERLKRMYGSEA
jgi:signal transduction histidine kinase